MQLGAFLAGALLAETNFRTQIEADIRPFRGLLLGLFFVTTGTSIDMQVRFINVLPNSTAMQIRERLMFEDFIEFYFLYLLCLFCYDAITPKCFVDGVK